MLRHVTILLSPCMAIMLAGPVAAQQAYPSKPVRLIVPFPPGGANNIVARLIGQRFNDRWARVVVIDNRAGAGGNIGTEIGARTVPDGYTLLIGSTSTRPALRQSRGTASEVTGLELRSVERRIKLIGAVLSLFAPSSFLHLCHFCCG